MTQRYIPTYFAIVFLLTLSAATAQSLQREIKRTSEKEVKVRINSSFGSVNMEKGSTDKIIEVYYRKKNRDNKPRLDMDYRIRKDVGDLEVELHPGDADVETSSSGEVNVKVNGFNFKPDQWYIKLVQGVPLSIKAELGAGKSDFDLTGLTLNELTISTGASSSKVRFNEMNKGEIGELQIETGVSKFVAENLNNANFRKMTFEGGVGSYYLDFGGELKRTVDVNVNVGLGAVTVVIPKNIGVKIKYEDSWLSNFSIDDEFIRKKKGMYESENYSSADGRMNIYIESGLGSVKIRRSK